jgi:exopolyphosphatase/guanosine-5'-triphosphate,3'-diphosphate pyrophosphatase
MDASIAVLGDYASLISKFGVRHVKAVATSALRDASNADIFIKKVFDTTGISIQVISGRKEAEFTLRGVLSSLAESALRVPHSILIIDMGGGSTEWILCRDEDHVDMGSIPTGVINLTQKFIRTDPVSDNDVNALNHEIIAVLADLNAIIGPYITSDTQLIGTAGTFTTIASVDLALDTYSRDRIHLHIVSLPRLRGIGEDLLTRSLEERKRVRGLEAERADLIIPGILFTIDIMQVFRFDELIISDYGLLEGVLFEIKETVEKSISEAGQS